MAFFLQPAILAIQRKADHLLIIRLAALLRIITGRQTLRPTAKSNPINKGMGDRGTWGLCSRQSASGPVDLKAQGPGVWGALGPHVGVGLGTWDLRFRINFRVGLISYVQSWWGLLAEVEVRDDGVAQARVPARCSPLCGGRCAGSRGGWRR